MAQMMQQQQMQMQRQMQQGRPGGGGPPGVPTAGGPPAGYPGAGGPGGPGGIGGPGGDHGPADFSTPEGAVRAFLSAVKAKDPDRIAEATALRAQSEASSDRNKEFFGKILDFSLSDTELDDLAKMFEGYQIAGVNQVKSTGRLGIYLQKSNDKGGFVRRTLTVRKEKKGWGVMDVSRETEFKGSGNQPRRSGR